MKAKDFLPEGVINMSTLAAKAKQLLASGMTEQQVVQQLVKEGIPQRYAEQAVQAGQMNEDKFGTREKRERRAGSRPERSNADRSKQIHQLHGATGWDVSHLELLKPDELNDLHQKHVDQKVSEVYDGEPDEYHAVRRQSKKDIELEITKPAHWDKINQFDSYQEAKKYMENLKAKDPTAKITITTHKKKSVTESEEHFCENCGGSLAEAGKASRALCTGSKPDKDLGASNLASCKSQGLRARDGEKSHKLGKTAKSRIKVGGHRIKGNKYGGPLPDWS